MNKEEFQANIATWGADISRWPSAVQDNARAVATEPWARRQLADAASLDAILAAPAEISPDRVGRAIAGVNARIAARPRWQHVFQPWLAPAAGLLAAGMLGIVVGVSVTPETSELTAMGQFLAAAISYTDSGLLQAIGS